MEPAVIFFHVARVKAHEAAHSLAADAADVATGLGESEAHEIRAYDSALAAAFAVSLGPIYKAARSAALNAAAREDDLGADAAETISAAARAAGKAASVAVSEDLIEAAELAARTAAAHAQWAGG